MQDQIVITKADLSPVKAEGGKFIIQKSAEEALLRLKTYQKELEQVESEIKEYLTAEMEKNKTLRIEGEHVKVYRMASGAKYEVTDSVAAIKEGFATQEVKIKPVSKEIAKYEKETGELPAGIAPRERALKVSIRLVGDKESYE